MCSKINANLTLYMLFEPFQKKSMSNLQDIFDFLATIKVAPHECVIRTANLRHRLKLYYSKVSVSSCIITSVSTQNTPFSP